MIKLIIASINLLLFILLQASTVKSQNVMQVIEKKIEKQFKSHPDEVITIMASKAEIKVTTWNKEEVKLIIKFTASNANKAVGERELQYAKYRAFKETSGIEIQNMFVIPDNLSKLTSIITVAYELWIPPKRNIVIVNNYGDISLTNLDAKFKINLDLGNLYLDDINGEGEAHISYGDIKCSKIKGHWNFILSKATLDIDDAEGTYAVNGTYGNVTLSTIKQLDKLEIETARTEVTLNVPDITLYNLDISTTYSDIIIFNETYKKLLKQGYMGKVMLKSFPNKSLPFIKINTSYSPIIIKKLH